MNGGKQVQIAPMTMEQISQVAAIEEEVFSVPWPRQAFVDALHMEQACFYTACIDGRVAGYCGIYLAADEGEIANVAAAPAYRRMHLAQKLLAKVLEEARARGAVQIFLEVRKSNAPAIALYEKTQFRVVGSRKNYYECPTEDALVMMYEFADI